MILFDNRPTARQRELEDLQQRVSKSRLLSARGRTALSRSLTDSQAQWLTDYVTERWNTLYTGLGFWRSKLRRFEAYANGDFSPRLAGIDPEKSDASISIFDRSNHSLGVVSGFADYAFAQVRDEIFGTRPWLGATPVGRDDEKLTDLVTKHSVWKFSYTNTEEASIDAARLAIDLGTVFVKDRWHREIEKYQKIDWVAFDTATNQPLLNEAGDWVTDPTEIPEGTDGAGIEWRETLIPTEIEVSNNVKTDTLDFMEVAFDHTAPELDLVYTDFFHRFPIGLLDAASLFNLTREQIDEARNLIGEGERSSRASRSDGAPQLKTFVSGDEKNANPDLMLVEGYVRCDPFGRGEPIRIHVIFSPTLSMIFRMDYLANVTPEGLLPIHPVRAFKIPGRLLGKGYYEVYEDSQNAIDAKYNAACVRDRFAANPVGVCNESALADDGEEQDLTIEPGKLFKLKADMTMKNFLEFLTIPDTSSRTIDLMQQDLQMIQMRSGITSAAQGELKGVPEANTATGVNQIISRGAVLLKWPIDQIRTDEQRHIEYGVHLIYANQDKDETFTWGEGRDAELLEIKAGDVKGLRVNVTLSLTQSQNQQKLATAREGIQVVTGYIGIPELEKSAVRPLFIQALKGLGFNNAEDIIRDAISDPAGILAILPPDLQPLFQQFLATLGGGGVPADPAAPADAPVSPSLQPA